MSAPEVEWLLGEFASVVTWVGNNYTLENGDAATLERIDRDDSELLDSGSIRDRTAELQSAAYVGATLADRAPEPMGSSYDHQLDTVVGVRVEGLHESEFGHVDPDGANGVPFDALVRRLRRAALTNRTYPSVGRPDTQYYDVTITNEVSQSSDFADYYRYDFDCVLFGEETLP